MLTRLLIGERFTITRLPDVALLASWGVTLRSATEPSDEAPTGRLMGSVLSAMAQFENDVKAERTKAGMREALSRGRWVHQAPLGYLKAHGALYGPPLQSPVLIRIVTVPGVTPLVTAISGKPSPLKSPTAREEGDPPAV